MTDASSHIPPTDWNTVHHAYLRLRNAEQSLEKARRVISISVLCCGAETKPGELDALTVGMEFVAYRNAVASYKEGVNDLFLALIDPQGIG